VWVWARGSPFPAVHHDGHGVVDLDNTALVRPCRHATVVQHLTVELVPVNHLRARVGEGAKRRRQGREDGGRSVTVATCGQGDDAQYVGPDHHLGHLLL
jgi:hypothetical protein